MESTGNYWIRVHDILEEHVTTSRSASEDSRNDDDGTFLGTAVFVINRKRRASSILVDIDGDYVLLDAGPGIAQALADMQYPAPRIRFVFLTIMVRAQAPDFSRGVSEPSVVLGEQVDSEQEMKRSNLFSLAPTREQHRMLEELALSCAKLWNEVNYLHRQQYENYLRLDWNPHIYKRYVPLVGSATAQQIVRKNNEAWRSFLALKRMEQNGKLPSTIRWVKPPGYWKRDGRYLLRILFRCDSYHIRESCLQLPRRLSIPFKGELKWTGKQGRLEVAWDSLSKKWRVFQSVQVKPLITPLGSKTCYVDLGVRNLATVWLPEWRQPVAYQSGRLLADWWYWTSRIARHQQCLATVNGRRKSRQLTRLYRTRKNRFRHSVATFARQLIKHLYGQGVSRIVIGELRNIRSNNNHGRQGNAMVHNYWSHKHIADRLRWTAEEYGIRVETVSEAYTSQTCPRCRSRHSERVLRGFRCVDCGLEAHRDAVGVLNMAARCGEYAVRPMAWPMLLRWDGCGWNRNNGMPTQHRTITVEA